MHLHLRNGSEIIAKLFFAALKPSTSVLTIQLFLINLTHLAITKCYLLPKNLLKCLLVSFSLVIC